MSFMETADHQRSYGHANTALPIEHRADSQRAPGLMNDTKMLRITFSRADGLPRASCRSKPRSDRPHWEFRELLSIRQHMVERVWPDRLSRAEGNRFMHAACACAVCSANERGRTVWRCIFKILTWGRGRGLRPRALRSSANACLRRVVRAFRKPISAAGPAHMCRPHPQHTATPVASLFGPFASQRYQPLTTSTSKSNWVGAFRFQLTCRYQAFAVKVLGSPFLACV